VSRARSPISAARESRGCGSERGHCAAALLCRITGRVVLRAHRLSFGARQVGLERLYIFAGLGDEMAGIGCADLHVAFRSVRDWDSVLKRGRFGGWDRDVAVHVSAGDIREKKRVVWDFDRECRVEEGEGRPWFGVAVEAG
jgi:hypothetical protein